MTFKDSEGVRLLADHVKSVWALSASGIAFGSGLLGFISKDVTIPRYQYLVCLIFVTVGLCAYAYSVKRGIQAHKQLTDEVFRSEDVLVTRMEAEASIETISRIYYRCRSAFFVGCLMLAVGVLAFVTFNNLFRKNPKPSYFSVSLKNTTVITANAGKIEIEKLSFRITDPRSLPPEVSTLEVQDLVFEGRVLQPTN